VTEEKKLPYLDDPQRLGDVIAAIQAMGTYKFYKQTFEGWAARIAADTSKADHWKKVFEEHPEFFRLDTDRKMASLVLSMRGYLMRTRRGCLEILSPLRILRPLSTPPSICTQEPSTCSTKGDGGYR